MLMFDALSRVGVVDVVLVEERSKAEVLPSADGRIAAQVMWKAKALNLGRYAADRRLTQALEDRLPRRLVEYDLAVGRYLGSIAKIELPPSVPTLVDLDDFAHTLWDRRLSLVGVKNLARSLVIGWLSRAAMRRFDRFLFVTDRDKARSAVTAGDVLPNIPISGDPEPDFGGGGARILFVGSMWYGPNALAMDWFVANVWPGILGRVPDAELLIVGAASPEVRARWSARPRVDAPGFVASLADSYRSASIVVSPILTGGGSNIKVLEALAWGRPVVMSTFSHRAFENTLVDGVDVAVAADTSEFIEKCVDLLGNRRLRAALARSGHEKIGRYYSKERFERIIISTVEQMLEGQRAMSSATDAGNGTDSRY